MEAASNVSLWALTETAGESLLILSPQSLSLCPGLHVASALLNTIATPKLSLA